MNHGTPADSKWKTYEGRYGKVLVFKDGETLIEEGKEFHEQEVGFWQKVLDESGTLQNVTVSRL